MTTIAFALASCGGGDSDEPKPGNGNQLEILSFEIEGITVLMEPGRTPRLFATPGTDITNLTPTIKITPGAVLEPASGVPQDFSKPNGVQYNLTMPGSNNSWAYLVRAEYVTGLEKFVVNLFGRNCEGVVDPVKKEIRVPVPLADFRMFIQIPDQKPVTRVTLKKGFRVEPTSGTPIDLDKPMDQVVYDETTGVTTTYKLILLNTDAEVSLRLNLPHAHEYFLSSTAAGVSQTDHTAGLESNDLVIRVLPTDNISAATLLPRTTLPERCTITPALDQPQNFAQDVVYTITAEAGNTLTQRVRVVRQNFIDRGDGDRRNLINYSETESYPIMLYYRSISPVTSIKLISEDNAQEYTGTTLISAGYADDERITFRPTATLPSGKYRLHITLKNGNAFVHPYSMVTRR